MLNDSNINSYANIYELREIFRKSSGNNDVNAQINFSDVPGKYFFRLFFYFNNGGLLDNRYSGLQTEQSETNTKDVAYKYSGIKNHQYYDTAMNYLVMNGEVERAELLDKFISLLSNINTYSPWYFQEVTGFADTLGRKQLVDRDFKIEETRPMLTIKCLPDAVDDRIGTLLDLYRAVCFSYTQKKEVVPANLRRFTLGVYVFQAPKRNIHNYQGYKASFTKSPMQTAGTPSEDTNDNIFRANSKYFEFINCEFLMSSSASGYQTLNNTDGIDGNYEIGITFDDIYEERYNTFMMRTIGDFIKTDLTYNLYGPNGEYKETIMSQKQTDNEIRNKNNIGKRIIREYYDSSRYVTDEPRHTVGGSFDDRNLFEKTKFGQRVSTAYKEAKREANRIVEKYSPENLIGTATNYLVDKVDGEFIQFADSVKSAVNGSHFYDELVSRDTRTTLEGVANSLKEGNILRAADETISGGYKAVTKEEKEVNVPEFGSLFGERVQEPEKIVEGNLFTHTLPESNLERMKENRRTSFTSLNETSVNMGNGWSKTRRN